MKRDIKNRKDIIKLVNVFYDQVKTDTVIGFIFNDIAHANWDLHLPRMYDFWENILFYTGNFDGNPMITHRELSAKCEIKRSHYKHWNSLFNKTVDDLFKGDKADEIKQRAMNISKAMTEKALS